MGFEATNAKHNRSAINTIKILMLYHQRSTLDEVSRKKTAISQYNVKKIKEYR